MSNTRGTLSQRLKVPSFSFLPRRERRQAREVKIQGALREAARLNTWFTSEEMAIMVNVAPFAVRLVSGVMATGHGLATS